MRPAESLVELEASNRPPAALLERKLLPAKRERAEPRQSVGLDLQSLMSSLPIVPDESLSHAGEPISSFLSSTASLLQLPDSPPRAPPTACRARLAALDAVQRLPAPADAPRPTF